MSCVQMLGVCYLETTRLVTTDLQLNILFFKVKEGCSVINLAENNKQVVRILTKVAKEEEQPRFFVHYNTFEKGNGLDKIESQVCQLLNLKF